MADDGAGTAPAAARGKCRRHLTQEWLLLPMFALPAVLAVGAVAFAFSEHRTRCERLSRGGRAAAAQWLDADPRAAAWAAARFDEAVARAAADRAAWTEFRRPDLAGLVRSPGARPVVERWVLDPDLPGGLRPPALGDAAVRLAVESGTAISQSRGAETAASEFAGLLAHPSRPRLLAAPLSAATKLYLVRRFAERAPETVAPSDETTLLALRDVEESLSASSASSGDPPATFRDPRPLRPGSHAAGRTHVLVPTSGAPALVVPGGADVPGFLPTAVADDPEGVALLVFSPLPAATDGEELWRGRLEEPLAGEWAIVVPEGRAWWNSGAGGAFALPLAVISLAFLAVPSALLVAIRRRRRLDEARSRFVNEIAHDLRTPVAALRLHAELLASGRVADADRAQHAEILGREAARLTAALSNLLDLARLERGTRPFEREAVDAGEVVRDSVREFALLHPRRADDVRVEAPAELPVVADRTALARALGNLLDNAGKFTPEGTPIRVSAAAAPGGGAVLRVEDEGAGIPADERSRVFLPYERGSAAARTAAPGTGLGLSLVRELVQGMGGTVALVETPLGAAFEVRLPGAIR